MNRSFQLLTFGWLAFFTSGYAHAQITRQDKVAIQETCEVFLRQQVKVESDYHASTDSLKSVSSELITTMILAHREFYKQSDLEGFTFPLNEVLNLELSDSIGCVVNAEYPYKINVEQIDNKWIVVGFNNDVIDQKDIDELKVAIEQELKLEVVRVSIKEQLKIFAEGWSEIRQNQTSELLKSISTKEFYAFCEKSSAYDKLRGFNKGPVSIEDMEYISITADTANCRIMLKGLGGTRMLLLLQDNVWKIAGIDNRIIVAQDVLNIEENIREYKELDKFNGIIAVFNDDIEVFFKTGDRTVFNGKATDRFVNQLELYRRLSGTMDTSYISVNGLRSSLFNLDYSIYGDTAYFETYGDSIRWIKQNQQWIFDELFCGKKYTNEYDKAHNTYITFVDMMSASYSHYNSMNGQPPFPTIVMATSEVEELEPSFNRRFDRYAKEIIYSNGNDKLYQDIQNLTRKVASKTTYQGTIYVEFNVDNSGNVQNIHALDRAGTIEASLAEEIVSQLEKWLPNSEERPIISQMVIAIQFE